MLALATWFDHFRDRTVEIWTDNQALAYISVYLTTWDRQAMPVVRSIVLLAAQGNFTLLPRWLSSEDNAFADALSHVNRARFLALCPDLLSRLVPARRRPAETTRPPSGTPRWPTSSIASRSSSGTA